MAGDSVGGFTSAPIKLAALISERRAQQKSQRNHLNAVGCKSQQQQVHNKQQFHKRRQTIGGCKSRRLPLLLLSLFVIVCAQPQARAHYGLSQLVDSGRSGGGGSSGALAASERHRTHYMNIVPSSHFHYNEGRQSRAASELYAPVGEERAAKLLAADFEPHIYKRSSAAQPDNVRQPQQQHQVHSAGHTALVSSSSGAVGSDQHRLHPLNPLSRRMMRGGSAAAAAARWLSFGNAADAAMQADSGAHYIVPATSDDAPSDALTSVVNEALAVAASADEPQQAAPQQQQPSRHNKKDPREEFELLRQKQHIQYHDQWPALAGKCHKRTLNFCASVLPFNSTTFPNIIGDTNRFEVKRSLPFFGFLAKSSCNKRLDELLCLLLEPPCDARSGAPIPPCKKFCRLALEGCNEYIPATLAMSSVFDCRQYPDSSDANVCVNLAQGERCAHDEYKCPDNTCIPRKFIQSSAL